MKLGLAFSSLPERIGAEIDFLPLFVNPNEPVPVLTNLYFLKVLRLLQKSEYLSAGDDRTEIDNSCVAVIPTNFQHTMNDRLD